MRERDTVVTDDSCVTVLRAVIPDLAQGRIVLQHYRTPSIVKTLIEIDLDTSCPRVPAFVLFLPLRAGKPDRVGDASVSKSTFDAANDQLAYVYRS